MYLIERLNYLGFNMKLLCVFGVLRTEKGLLIKEKISNYLRDRFEILYIEQEPPGVLFEYPAIKCALETSVSKNKSVLYIHTKGAADPNRAWYQTPAKKLWEHEFGTDKVYDIFDKLNVDEPLIACPVIGPNNETWYNGKVINPSAAKIILETFHFDKDRFYYEWFMHLDPRIKSIGTFYSEPIYPGPLYKPNLIMQDNFKTKILELTKDLPEIDY